MVNVFALEANPSLLSQRLKMRNVLLALSATKSNVKAPSEFVTMANAFAVVAR
ncbi:hypothetical protein GBA52_018429 [Prunus armeniaca]|nr:hypothetical protein GBA52_018429 [Prunus armeniaca]